MTDHRHYIDAVAAALTTAGLPATSTTIQTHPHRAATITTSTDHNGEAIRLLWDEEADVWEYELGDGETWYAESRDWLPGGLASPPAIVVSELLYDSAYARHRLMREVPEDLGSALAAYAEPTGPRPGQKVRDAEGDVWTYINIGADEMHLLYREASGVTLSGPASALAEEFGPLTPVRDVVDVRLPERDAADVMPPHEEQQLVQVLDEIREGQ